MLFRSLKQPTMVQGTAPVAQPTNSYVPTPNFGMESTTAPTENNTVVAQDSNDQPIATPEQTQAPVENADANVSFTNTTTTDASNINWSNV